MADVAGLDTTKTAGRRDVTPPLALIAELLSPRAEKIAVEISARVRSDIPELRAIQDPAFWEAVHVSSQANLETGLAVAAGDRRFPRQAPLDAGDVARLAARAGASLSAVMRAYRIGHSVTWEHVLVAAEEIGMDSHERLEALRATSEFLFAFVDHVANLVTDEYLREREGALRALKRGRVELVREVLEGVAADAGVLEYDLSHQHVGVVASGDGVEAALKDLAAGLDRRLLAVRAEDGLLWGWLGGGTALDTEGSRLLRRFAPPGGATVAFGGPASGLEGFRVAHRQARDALGVARRSGRSVVSFRDVALEVLATRDEGYAREFVIAELGELAEPGERAHKLRETLRAYFAAGQNASAAAAMLGVHDQTVSYRLRAVEKSIGDSIAARRGELETALRLRAVLEPEKPAH